MYHIQYSLVKDEWKQVVVDVDVNVLHQASIMAVSELRRVLNMIDIQLMYVGDFSYAIWAQNECQGFVAITEAEVYISQQRINPWKSRGSCYL